ncbi:PIG-L deacetylase family protein [Leptothoe sp. PORK10 BA2]|uniref:PIG-L deacetylase family protein n=1 Tax=Leptothoe sp. PORK10 BA2 TaxID=3110254 RepID=UPI002B20A2E1|nr:PIG-L deacetylase family protein [Leptothoe sp. PORK10 BA2]MEA5463761.1 PIG-L deacetylase family protein [Leptothoe sp. PORK10 BA2]
MLKLIRDHQDCNSFRRILCLGAHSDDIEIGCGGTILKMMEQFQDAEVCWVVFSADGHREKEALASANSFLEKAHKKTIIIQQFRERFFPYIGIEIKEFFDQLSKDFSPDLILTHYRNDLHQDHRLISELTWNAFRNHMILEYEIPKYDGDLGNPNFFVHLDESLYQRKVAYLMQHFQTQSNKQWFDEETFSSILRLRGIESNAPDKYAEAFYCRKAILI